MATLGDILGAARRSAAGFERWIESSDPHLAGELRRAAEESGQSPAGFTRSAVADFSRFADEEDWAALTRIVWDDADPGSACLAAMINWRLSAKRCPDHDRQHSGEQPI